MLLREATESRLRLRCVVISKCVIHSFKVITVSITVIQGRYFGRHVYHRAVRLILFLCEYPLPLNRHGFIQTHDNARGAVKQAICDRRGFSVVFAGSMASTDEYQAEKWYE